jgi:ABC-type multidrug transport system ATPase subunit
MFDQRVLMGGTSQICDARQATSIAFLDVTKEAVGRSGTKYPIIDRISGQSGPGELLSVMGLSGSGKTTLLQVISGRSNENISGQVFLDQQLLGPRTQAMISYVWQDDNFYPSYEFTVRDQLCFAAFIRMPANVSARAVYQAVNRVIEVMHLTSCADHPIHVVSGGERRRTTIAKELLAEPRILLIDEGTSGLDSAAARNLVVTLKALAKTNQIPIIMSIHQPSTRVFYLFDCVLFLSEGHCVYNGPPAKCMEYFLAFDFTGGGTGTLPPETSCNPADYVLDLLYSDIYCPKYGKWPRYAAMSAWLEHEHQKQQAVLAAGLQVRSATMRAKMCCKLSPRECNEADDAAAAADLESDCHQSDHGSLQLRNRKTKCGCHSSASARGGTWQVSPRLLPGRAAVKLFWRRVYANYLRTVRHTFKVEFSAVNIVQHLFMALLVGCIWFRIRLEEQRVGDFAGFIFFTIAYWFFAGMYDGMLDFLLERGHLHREIVSGDNYVNAYFLGKTLAAAPIKCVIPTLFAVVSYSLVSPTPDVYSGASFAAVVVLSAFAGSSVGALIGCCTRDHSLACSLTTVAALAMLILGGFYMKTLPAFIQPLSTLSIFRYVYRAAVQVCFVYVRDIPCNGGHWIPACAPTSDSVQVGYISGKNVVVFILDDSYRVGLWSNLCRSVQFCIVCRILALLSLRVSETRLS